MKKNNIYFSNIFIISNNLELIINNIDNNIDNFLIIFQISNSFTKNILI